MAVLRVHRSLRPVQLVAGSCHVHFWMHWRPHFLVTVRNAQGMGIRTMSFQPHRYRGVSHAGTQGLGSDLVGHLVVLGVESLANAQLSGVKYGVSYLEGDAVWKRI